MSNPHINAALETLALGASVAIRNAQEFERMRQKAVALGTVHSVYRLVSTTRLVGDLFTKEEILSRLGKLILQVLNVRKCSIMLLDKFGILHPYVALGLEEGEVGRTPLKVGEAIPGVVADELSSLLVESPLDDRRFADDSPALYPSQAYLSVPLVETEATGVITVADKVGTTTRFSDGDREVLHTIAEQAVIALLNIDFFEKQGRMALDTMGTFDNMFETGDPDVDGKAHLLANLADRFGQFLKIDSHSRQMYQMGSFIHAMAAMKLAKHKKEPDRVEDESLKQIEMAIRMARKLDLPDEMVSILRDCDENFDGSGGPRGLKGEEIPLGSRIISLLDTYLNLTSPEGNGTAIGDVQAMNYLHEGSDCQFDPNLVQSFGQFLEETGSIEKET